MAKYTLDQIAERIMAREEARKNGDYFMTLEGVGGEGGWNNTTYDEKHNWNLTPMDIRDITEILSEDDEKPFKTEIVKSKNSSVAQCNDAVLRMKAGDCSKFNHLPPFMREYFGKIAFEKVFNNLNILPDADEIKDTLEENIYRPEFRYAITKLIERNAMDKEGRAIANTLRNYDRYMNKRMFASILDPVSEENAMRLREKHHEKADTLLEENKEKQAFLAKNLFMTQLGRIDIKREKKENDQEDIEPFDDNITELMAHGSRIMYILPPGEETDQEVLLDEWKGKALKSEVIDEGRFASHDMHRRHVDDDGNMTKPAEEIQIKWMRQLKKGELNKKLATYSDNYGFDVPMGGLGREFNKKDCVDGEGTFGHAYIRSKKGEKNRCGAILMGFENSSPGKESCIGQMHDFKAVSHDISPALTDKTNVGAKIGGREVDLTNFKASELTDLLRRFDAGYRELQSSAVINPRAARKLKKINDKLCGKYMSALDLANLMTSLGMEKDFAIKNSQQGRLVRNVKYTKGVHSVDKYLIQDETKVRETKHEQSEVENLNELRKMTGYIDSMRRQWNSMANHTLFHSWNTDEFIRMENTLKDYLTAYDNVMAGKTPDGDEFRPNSSILSDRDMNWLRFLEKEMTNAAKAYHIAKEFKKDGGFEKHKTAQAKDRDAMSLMISNFSEEARNEESRELLGMDAVNNKEKDALARKKLDERVAKYSQQSKAVNTTRTTTTRQTQFSMTP